jgi:hypothetical protein
LAFEDFLGGLCPYEGTGGFVLSGDEGADGGGQFADVAEGSAVDGLALDDTEPTSTRLSQDAEVGVKCTWMRGFSVSQSQTPTHLWAA